MSINGEHFRAACDLIATSDSIRQAASAWTLQQPGVRMVVVDALDMRDEVPALRIGAGRNVYMAASNGHCWHVTTQPEDASVLIVTQD